MFVKASVLCVLFHELCLGAWEVAQVLSVRPEAVPEEYRNEFRKIQP